MERPILFSGPMVRALLEGRKTETRRIAKPQPPSVEDVQKKSGTTYSWLPPEGDFKDFRVAGPVWAVRELMGVDHGRQVTLHCPYGRPGDRLWVKETWSPWADGMTRGYLEDCRDPNAHLDAVYAANHPGCSSLDAGGEVRWRSPLFMPREMSRLSLVITEVRAEPLHALTEDDAKAEGVAPVEMETTHRYRRGFAALWESLNAQRAPWASNPWVWVVRFQRLELAARRSA